MKKIFFAAAIISIFSFQLSTSHAQSDPVILEVGGQQIRQNEFMRDFRQSVGDALNARNASATEKRQALDEYVELYANFRAKLLDASAMGLDTASDMLNELARYRKDLAAPYLIDSTMLEAILREAYDRNHYSLHAAHVLVRISSDAAPEDTLVAYNRALDYRNRILEGEDIFALAAEEAHRNDTRARILPNEGELNMFSAFDMVYPFENAAYALKEGEVSMPVRTRFGYHVIKLFDRVEIYGKVTIQHIWVRNQKDQSIIVEMYNRLASGTPFEMVCRQSDDRSTANNGGFISDASLAQLPHEYVKKISELNVGEFTKPFMTRYGWHIVKLVNKETIPPFETMVPYYKQRLVRDQRGDASRHSFAVAARKKYGILDYTTIPVVTPAKKGAKKAQQQPVKMKASHDELLTLIDKSVFEGRWHVRDTAFHNLAPLVHTPSVDYDVRDFARFIRRTQKVERDCDFNYYVEQRYQAFLDSVSIAYADSQLEKEYPEFADLVNEYRRGLIIFSYNEQMIWGKAVKDSAGFADFYARESSKKSLQNPDDSLFFWRSRARFVDFTVADSACLAPDKAVKILTKALSKNRSSEEMKEMLLDKVNRKHCTANEPVAFKLQLVEQGRQKFLADDQWKRGVYAVPAAKGYRLFVVQDILAPALKEQMEARGYYLNAWQNEVERDVNDTLRAKYNVKINRDAVNKIAF
jgi:peptidyl-prolyl cis-trans isomerase SurA